MPDKVWIGNGHAGFWQHVEYENLPAYCSFCHKIGHDEANCSNNPEGLPGQPQCQPIKQAETQLVWKAKPATQQAEEITGPTLIKEHQPHGTEKAAPAATVLCTSQAMANGAGSLQDLDAGPSALAVGLAAAAAVGCFLEQTLRNAYLMTSACCQSDAAVLSLSPTRRSHNQRSLGIYC